MTGDLLPLFRLRPIRLFALTMAAALVVATGCRGAAIPPPGPAATEAEKEKADEAEVKDQAWNPFVVVERGGRIFMTYYGGRGGSEYRLMFTRSLDGGLSWLPEPVELDAEIPRGNRIGFHRLETNGEGRISVTWAIEYKAGTVWRAREVRHRQSSDSGTTWRQGVLRRQFLEQSNYPTAVTGRDGAVYLLWMEGPAQRPIPRFIRTTDAGATWAPDPVTLPGVEGAAAQPRKRDPSIFRDAHWPVLALGPRGTLYAIWQEALGPGTDILFNRSKDGGSTWLELSPRLNTPPSAPTHTARIPVAAVTEEGHLYVVWEDFRHGTTDLYFNRSLDGGVTWLAQDTWLTAVRPRQASATSPFLSVDRSGRLYLLWTDIRDAPFSLYFTRSLDRGASWLSRAIRVDRNRPDEIAYAPRLAHDEAGHVYAAWWQGKEATKGTVVFSRSDDYGATWSNTAEILDAGHGTDGPRFPWLSADNQGGVYIVWSSDRTGRYQLYANRSLDHGKTWLSNAVQVTGLPASRRGRSPAAPGIDK
ncbi:MAG: sialidase family protein [Candidatus Methylomirabilaceae bacterium]